MEIIKWDTDLMKMLPGIFKIIKASLFSDKGAAYVILDDGKLDIFARSGGRGVYINNKGDKVEVSSYLFDKDYKIKSFAIGNKQYGYLNERVNAIENETNIEQSLLLTEMTNSSEPDGFVTYTQYDRERDIECEIQYKHRYYKSANEERGRIYPYRLTHISSLMIDEHSGAKHVGPGLIGKGHEYYTVLEATPDYYDYSLVALKEAGLVELVKQGAESILKDSKITRYIKGVYMGRDGVFRPLWPLGKTYKEEDLFKLIKDYGFDPTIPSDLFEIYNDQHELVNKVKEVLSKVKEIDEAKDQERCLLYSLHP